MPHRTRINVREETSYRYLAVAHCDEAGHVTVEFEPICGWVDYEIADKDEDGDPITSVESVPLVYDGDAAAEMYFDTAIGIAVSGDGIDWLGRAEKMFGRDGATVMRARAVN